MERRSDHGPGALSRCHQGRTASGERDRGHYHFLRHPVTGPTLYMGSPFLLSATPAALRPAPCLGQHNAYVYGELLGMNAADMARYTAAGIFY